MKRRLLSAVAISSVLVIASAAVPARAALVATLLDCQGVTTVTGQFAYQGTYSVPGYGTVTKMFSSWCPATIQVS